MEPRKRSGTRRKKTQHATRIFTAHAHLSASAFLLSRHPPQCAAVEAKKFTVRAVEASHGEASCENKCNFLGSNSDGCCRSSPVVSTTAVAWVCSPVCQCGRLLVPFVPILWRLVCSRVLFFCGFVSVTEEVAFLPTLQQRPLMVKSWASASACGAGTSDLQPEGFALVSVEIAQAISRSRGFKLPLTASSQQVPFLTCSLP